MSNEIAPEAPKDQEPADSKALSVPIFASGRYENPLSFSGWHLPSFGQNLKYLFSRNPSPIPDQRTLDTTLPVRKPDFATHSASPLAITWLGHATCLVQMDGVAFIIDPVWAERASPFRVVGPYRRYRPPPCTIDELPGNLHFVIISHNHYDHLDRVAVRKLAVKYPTMHWFVPKGMGRWMESAMGAPRGAPNISEMSWWVIKSRFRLLLY